MGASLDRVHIPGRPPSNEDSIPDGEVEIGMGNHNEPGPQRVKATLPKLVQAMLSQILDLNDPDRAYITYKQGDEFVLLINNFGWS